MPLHRSSNAVIAGVCGGLADWLGWSPSLVRLLYVVISILSALMSVVGGLWLSWLWSLASGASIVLFSATLFFGAFLVGSRR